MHKLRIFSNVRERRERNDLRLNVRNVVSSKPSIKKKFNVKRIKLN